MHEQYEGHGAARKRTRLGSLWKAMKDRCKHSRNRPRYVGCSVAEEFLDFHIFADWCVSQTGYDDRDDNGNVFHLDKDLLIKGNTVYSTSTCVFIPAEVNMFTVKRNSKRGQYPVGVTYESRSRKNSYAALCRVNRKFFHLGAFKTAELAFEAYKECKESEGKRLAEKYRGRISDAAYFALCNYRVDIDD